MPELTDEQLESELKRTGVQPESLSIEITEGSTARHKIAIDTIRSLRQRGHRVQLQQQRVHPRVGQLAGVGVEAPLGAPLRVEPRFEVRDILGDFLDAFAQLALVVPKVRQAAPQGDAFLRFVKADVCVPAPSVTEIVAGFAPAVCAVNGLN